MKKEIRNILFIMLVALLPLAFTSCELDGPLAHFRIVVNDRLDYIPQDIIFEIENVNEEFASVPCEKEDAIERFNKVCNNLQIYYDENSGALIWDNLSIEICLYNTTSDKGVGEGLLVKSRIVTYSCE